MAKKKVTVSPGKGGVNHNIKKPIAKKKTEKLNIVERMVRSSPRTSGRKVLADIKNSDGLVNKVDVIKKVENTKIKEEDEEMDNGSYDDPEFDGMCEYEKIRMQNILARQKMLQELQINEAKFDLTPSKPSKHTPSSRGLASEKKPKEVLPPRKSARIAGGLVPEISRFVPLIEEPEEENYASLEVLDIKDSFNNADDEEFVKKTKELFTGLATYSRDLKTEPKTENCSSLESRVRKLNITDELVAKVVPDRIFSLSLHPGSAARPVCAVGGKHGHVGVWDVMARDPRFRDGVHAFQPHVRPINTLTWDTGNTSRLVTTSYDGTSRVLDCAAEQWQMLYGDQTFLESGGWTSCHAQQSPDTFLISQGSSGTVVMVDTRLGWAQPALTLRCFDRLNPKSLSVHPLQPSLFLAGTNKGGCFIFDVRAAASPGKSLTKPVSELTGHARSLSSCVFSRETGGQVASLASDDKLRLYDTTSITSLISPQCAVSHNNQTGRWLTPLRVTWHPTRDGMLVCGSMARPRQIEVWSTVGGDLRLSARLTGEALGSVASIVDIHPSSGVVAGGNSSGRCHVFM